MNSGNFKNSIQDLIVSSPLSPPSSPKLHSREHSREHSGEHSREHSGEHSREQNQDSSKTMQKVEYSSDAEIITKKPVLNPSNSQKRKSTNSILSLLNETNLQEHKNQRQQRISLPSLPAFHTGHLQSQQSLGHLTSRESFFHRGSPYSSPSLSIDTLHYSDSDEDSPSNRKHAQALYKMFCLNNRARLQALEPNVTNRTISRRLVAMWNKMSNREKRRLARQYEMPW